MPTVFVSYRRGSTTAVVHRLAERLEAEFGAGNVFLDVDSLPPGEDFRTHIRAEIARCQCAVVVIGADWLGATGRRIDDPSDFVRLEVEELLARGIPVVPVLADRTSMPAPDLLPESLRSLSFRHAEPLDSGLDFSSHVERLCRKLLGDAPVNPPNNRWLASTLIGCVAVAAVVLAVILLNRPNVDPPAIPQVSTTGDGSPAVVNTGNNNTTVINPPDKETPKAIKELVEQQKEEARKAEEQRKKKEADDEARRKVDDERKEREAKAEADRKYREAIKEDVNAILAVARIHSGKPAELDSFIAIQKSVGSPAGRGRTYSALALILAEQKKHAEARAAFLNADAQYKSINDEHMRRWIAEQIAALPKE